MAHLAFLQQSLSCSILPEALARNLPRYPIPVALIGQLAVDNQFQGKGLSSILLADVCHKVTQASSVLAVAGIIVDAKDQKVVFVLRVLWIYFAP